MDLQERIKVLFQSAELAQKAGALTIDDAYMAKRAMDALKSNVAYREAFSILIGIAEKGQKKGAYTLRDSYLIYLAIEGYENVIPSENVQAVPDQQETARAQQAKTKTKKESN